MAIHLHIYTGGPVACNGYLLEGADGYVAIDAPEGFADWIRQELKGKESRLKHLLLTHQHFDHVQDAALLQERTGCCIHACMPYSSALTLERQAASWGIAPVCPYRVDDAFGATCTCSNWGGLAWRIHAIPGHSTDGVAYQLAKEKCLFVGDILFAGSVGRTDFPGGSQEMLLEGIRQKLLPEPPDTRIYSGHGPSSSLGEEILHNPWLSL